MPKEDAAESPVARTISKIVPNYQEEARRIVFLPGRVVGGIEPSDDPLIPGRDGAYAISFARRAQ